MPKEGPVLGPAGRALSDIQDPNQSDGDDSVLEITAADIAKMIAQNNKIPAEFRSAYGEVLSRTTD